MKKASQSLRKTWKTIIEIITPSNKILRFCGKAVLAFLIVFFAVSLFVDFNGSMNPFYLLLYLLVYIGAGAGIAWVVSLLLGVFGRAPWLFRFAVIFGVLSIFYYFYVPKVYGRILLMLLILFPVLIAAGLYRWRRKELFPLSGASRHITFVLFVIGVAGLSVGGWFYFSPGNTPEDMKNAKKSVDHLPELIQASDPSENGKYGVVHFTYGSGNDKQRPEYRDSVRLTTGPVDASKLLPSWKGFSGKLRTWFFGFDASELPLNAHVWYPEKQDGPAPLVIIVHGNHLAQDYSEGGYAYLGELLASRGYIVASVDENFLNSGLTDFRNFGGGLNKENGVRGWLLLKHLQQWKKWNEDPSGMFHNRVDMDRIALIGHSRGGEAVGHAALFNRLPSFPDDATVNFDFNFNIRAVIAIAPVDGQYEPSSELAVPQDVNYFVLQGTHDMDMRSYGGLAMYKRIKFSPEFEGFKAGLYIHRANHGQFNSSWGRKDGSSPYINSFNLEQLIPEEQQQQVAKTYISAFLEVTLKDNPAYRPVFMDYRFARKWLPDLIYFNQYESSDFYRIADYDEDMNVHSATLKGGWISSENLSVWNEKRHNLMWNDHITKAVHIGWDSRKDKDKIGSYTLNLPDSISVPENNPLFTFSLAQSDEDPSHKEKEDDKDKEDDEEKDEDTSEEEPLDFTIELTDTQGRKISFPLSTCSFVQPQIQKKITKFAFLNSMKDTEAIPDFFYFDMNALQAADTVFRMRALKQIRFVFDKSRSGVIILDDVGIMQKKGRVNKGQL
ncbi:hypothetical protein [Sinomicrobium sp. M5D2P17]